MPLQLAAVTFDADDPAAVASFWAGLLGRQIVAEANGALLPGDDTQVGLRFAAARNLFGTEKSAPNRLHLHVTSSTLDDQQRTIETALGLGAHHVDVGQLPEEDHVVLADPGGNAFCVLGPGNNFLAGCGFLGEVACDGTREVGVFWSDALAWPLVWDQDGETAVQSPCGGTKVSWGGPPLAPKNGRARQRFDLIASDLAAEVERLRVLGATPLGAHDGGFEMADPDGNEFSVGPSSISPR